MELNKDFLSSMKGLLSKEEYVKFVESYQTSQKRGLVINNIKIDNDTFINEFEQELTNLEFDKNCYMLNSDEKLGNSVLHKIGAFYLQEPSAMLPALLLPIKDEDIVLDVCASPGGKSFQIARRLNGILVSNEIDFERAKKLQSNIERLGVRNAIITNFDSEGLKKNYPNCFDCVLVDAPCSGEGMFRRDEFARNQWSKNLVDEMASLQFEILTNVDKTLKSGGYLIYSTCTFSLEENEQNVAKLVDLGYEIKRLPNIKGAVNGVKIKGYNTDFAKRVYPHNDLGEGQFVCLLQKCAESEGQSKKFEISLNVHEKKVVEEFLNKNLVLDFDIDKHIVIKDKQVYYCENKNLIRKTNIMNYGVKLGELEKNRFEPHHNLFTAFGNAFKVKIELDKEQTIKFLQGQTLTTDMANGWCALSYKGCCFAGGKIVNGMIKNHYPKGLRLKI